MAFTCIIPFYNEGTRVINVLEAVKTIKCVTQIICIDDGSTDNMHEQISKKYPGVDLLRLKNNQGKSYAVIEGLKSAKNQDVIMLDADLTSIKTKEFQKTMDHFARHAEIDMILFKIEGGNNLLDKIMRKEIFMAGNRLIRKKYLEEIIKKKPKDYQIDLLINKHMQDKNIYHVKTSARNIHKSFKHGLIKGLLLSFTMELDLLFYMGLKEYLMQMMFFCRKEIKL